MAALTADRDPIEIAGARSHVAVKGGVGIIYQGAGVVRDSGGYLRPAGTGTVAGQVPVGVANEQVDTTGLADGAVDCEVRHGIFHFANSAAADEITGAEVGDVCYFVDDQTVAKTSGGATRAAAGRVHNVTSSGVAVVMQPLLPVDGDLVAANNLSDVASAATARGNLGVNKMPVYLDVDTLVGSNTYHVVSPVAGTIDLIYSVIDGVLTTGNATLQAKINGVNVTTGLLTVTQAGSAAGDVDTASPTAAKTVAVGDAISVTVGGTNATATKAKMTLLITY